MPTPYHAEPWKEDDLRDFCRAILSAFPRSEDHRAGAAR